jgi:hypothetical protein
MVSGTIASETMISNDTTAMQNSIENSTQSNSTESKLIENMMETDQTGSISGRMSGLSGPSSAENCTVC